MDKTRIDVASTLYRETCNNIRTTDEISFKLLGLVPLVSGAGIFFISANKDLASSSFAAFISFFGAIVTVALFIWELRNISVCRSYIAYAKILERYHFNEILAQPRAEGQFSGRPKSKIITKTTAEYILYTATIFAWLAFGIMSLINLIR